VSSCPADIVLLVVLVILLILVRTHKQDLWNVHKLTSNTVHSRPTQPPPPKLPQKEPQRCRRWSDGTAENRRWSCLDSSCTRTVHVLIQASKTLASKRTYYCTSSHKRRPRTVVETANKMQNWLTYVNLTWLLKSVWFLCCSRSLVTWRHSLSVFTREPSHLRPTQWNKLLFFIGSINIAENLTILALRHQSCWFVSTLRRRYWCYMTWHLKALSQSPTALRVTQTNTTVSNISYWLNVSH